MDIHTAMRIAQNDDFKKRVKFNMVKVALYQAITEPDSADVLLLQRVLKSTEPIDMWAIAVLADVSIMAGAHDENGVSIQDATLETRVSGLWDIFKL